MLEELRNVLGLFPLSIDGLERGGDSATPFVTHDNKERGLEVVEGVAHAAEHIRRDDVPGHADDEEVSEPLSNTSSGGTRESLHARIVAKGCWPPVRFLRQSDAW